ncbi:hypothetical protein HK100_006332 [Physocladia obscura]|uniref:Uncharacterized protein n=1 Tax=Physocladia obscura TaxID=109957 RepID=A0AAD5T596_9FUNG|nr:hypothetical protein HK100_006332 [Physocladia obscura]
MLEISEAIKAGAIVATETGGFHARNTKIALAQRMIAFTWSDGNSPEKGGTLDTWKKCKGLRVHVGLKSIVRTEMVEAAGKGQPEVVCKRKRDEEKEEKTTQKRSCL